MRRTVQSGTVRRPGPTYARRVMPIDLIDSWERRARIEQMIEEFRSAKERRLLRRALRLWQKAETHQLLTALEAGPERVH